MMKIKIYFIVITLSLIFPHVSYAEVITRFESQMQINTDGSINIVENINYDPQGASKQGIYRNLRLNSTNISNIQVYRDTFISPYQVTRGFNNLNIRIGEEGVFFSTNKNYQLNYILRNAIISGREKETLLHGITGSDWDLPILEASTDLIFPQPVTNDQIEGLECAIVSGQTMIDNQCTINRLDNTTLRIISNRMLLPGEGLSFIVSFPVGIVQQSSILYRSDQETQIALYILGVGLTILFIIWWVWGRSQGLKKTIVRQYIPPEKITPAAVGYLRYKKTDKRLISATIISLAQQGIISVKQDTTKKFSSKSKYKFDLIDEDKAKAVPYMVEALLLENIFRSYFISSGRYFSGLKAQIAMNDYLSWNSMKIIVGVFVIVTYLFLGFIWSAVILIGYLIILEITKRMNTDTFNEMYQAVYLEEVARYYTKIPQSIKKVLGYMVILGIISGFILYIYGYIIVALACIILTFITVIIIQQVPKRNQAGNEMLEYILGLEEYIITAEKERLDFHGKEHVFFELLPYAIVLGHEKNWAKAFEGLVTAYPEWFADSAKFRSEAFIERFVSSLVYHIPVSVDSSMVNTSLLDGDIVSTRGVSGFGGGFGSGGGGGGSW